MNGNILIFIVFSVILVGIGSYVYKDQEKQQKKYIPPDLLEKDETISVIEDILGPMCYGRQKPDIKCDNDDEMICDTILGKWRCRLTCEDEENNPFPYDFKRCKNPLDVKCDDAGNFYCKNEYCLNGGVLYSNENGKCSCIPGKFKGDRCEYSIGQCGLGGNVDESDSTKCETCCNTESIVDDKCRYGLDGAGKCSVDCESKSVNKKNSVFDSTDTSLQGINKCVCPFSGELRIDGDKKTCFIPQDRCDPIGTEKETSATTSPTTSATTSPTPVRRNLIVDDINDSRYGLCKCKNGYTGPLCSYKFCLNGGTYSVDGNGKGSCTCIPESGFSGDRCQYSRSFCSNNGNPKIMPSGNLKCICDVGYDGDKCQCKLSEKPAEDKCRGVIAVCDVDTNGTPGWVVKPTLCNDIYNSYGDNVTGKANWRKECRSVLLSPQKIEKGYEIDCQNDSLEPTGKRIIDYPSCNVMPTNEMLRNCRQTANCYNPFDFNNEAGNEGAGLLFERRRVSEIPPGFDKACVCSTENGPPKYECKQITDDRRCGEIPPLGFCKKGGMIVNPYCVAPYGSSFGPRAWVCPGAVIPPNIATSLYNVRANETGLNLNSKWYNTTGVSEQTTVYPTIDMDRCIRLMNNFQTAPEPYNQLKINTASETEPAWMSLHSEPGYVDSLTTNPNFTSLDDIKSLKDKYIRFNNRLKDDTVIYDTVNQRRLNLAQFMDLYSDNEQGDKNVLTNGKFKLENANPGLTNLDNENINVVKPYNIFCAVPLNRNITPS